MKTVRDRRNCIDLSGYGAPGWTLGLLVVSGPGSDAVNEPDDTDMLLIDEAHHAAGGHHYTRGLDIPHEQVGPLPQRYAIRIHRATT
jgi:hypothetical protein